MNKNKITSLKVSNSFLTSLLGLAVTTSGSDLLANSFFGTEKEENALYYFTPKNNIAYKLDENRWVKEFNDKNGGGRFDFLIKMYSATTKAQSNTGQIHAACFMGEADEIVKKFFSENLKTINFSQVNAVASEDLKTIGITMVPDSEFQKKLKKSFYHFRLNHCLEAGKNQTFDFSKAQIAKLEEIKRLPASEVPVSSVEPEQVSGFDMLDKVHNDSFKLSGPLRLPRFELRSDYENAIPQETDRPWKGLDLNKEDDRMKFARVTLHYFLKGMADQSRNTNYNFIAQKNKKTYWCHMPWLNTGDAGRELVHGLTKERDVEPSKMYPDMEPGSNWGIGYYNSHGCVTIGKVFGGSNTRKAVPEFYEHKFEDGTISVKILFTTSPSKRLDGSLTLKAHVSGPGSNFRQIQNVRMIQIDIAVKDSLIKGTSPLADHWVMTSYYYDPTFTWDFASEFKNKNMKGLMHMRPIGTHAGFDDKSSFIFPGAITNSDQSPFGPDKLLNGPADNPKSSCMGCHGTAGGSYRGEYKMAPGILNFEMYTKFKKTKFMDFSQQLSFAKRNFDTQPKLKK